MEWGTWLEIGAAVLALLALLVPLVLLLARRRWLTRQGGAACGLRLPGGSWRLGVVNYHGEHLEWYPALGLGFSPRVKLRRTATSVVGSREQGAAEAVLLYAGQLIVQLASTPDFGEPQEYELALDRGSMTALLSWLEAAPPSVGRFIS